MNEEFTGELQTRIINLMDVIESAGDFAIEQTPLVAQEILAWHFWFYVCLLCIFSLSWIAIFSLLIYIRKNLNKEKRDYRENIVVLVVFKLVSVVVLIVASIEPTINIIKVCVAPRLVLLEALQELIKGM